MNSNMLAVTNRKGKSKKETGMRKSSTCSTSRQYKKEALRQLAVDLYLTNEQISSLSEMARIFKFPTVESYLKYTFDDFFKQNMCEGGNLEVHLECMSVHILEMWNSNARPYLSYWRKNHPCQLKGPTLELSQNQIKVLNLLATGDGFANLEDYLSWVVVFEVRGLNDILVDEFGFSEERIKEFEKIWEYH